jgi:hypothetical protein
MNNLESEVSGIAGHEIQNAGRWSHGIGHIGAEACLNQSQCNGLVAGEEGPEPYRRRRTGTFDREVVEATELFSLLIAAPG